MTTSRFLRLILLLPAVFVIAGQVDADDAAILKQASDRCAQFEADVADMHMVQVMKTHTLEGEMTFEQTVYTKGKKSRVEMKMPLEHFEGGEGEGNLQTVMINDGTHAWIISPFGERKELSEEEAKLNEPARNCWGYFPENARLTGTEIVDGRDCHIVTLEENGVSTQLWLDQRTFIPVKGESHDSSGTEDYSWTHSDFRTILGEWEYPYSTVMYEGEELAASMNVTTLEVNQGLSDDLFDPDKVEVTPLDLDELMKMLSAPEDTGGAK